MAADCIHGLEAGLCDQCYPKPVPEGEVKVVRPRGAAKRVAGVTTTTKAPAVDVSQQRIFHVTHVSNLPGILEAGKLIAGATPVVDISSADNRERRRTAAVSAEESAAEFVPFFLTPNATLWEDIRSGAADPRLSTDMRHAVPAEFVMLVSTVTQAATETAVVADGDAAGSLTRFVSTEDGRERMLRRLVADDDSIIAAEFLVKESFPIELITLVGVAHDKARDEVKSILRRSAFSPKVAVYPPWFQRPEA